MRTTGKYVFAALIMAVMSILVLPYTARASEATQAETADALSGGTFAIVNEPEETGARPASTSAYSSEVAIGETTSMTLYFTANINVDLTSDDDTIATAVVTGTSVRVTSSGVSYGRIITISGIGNGETTINVLYGSTVLATIDVAVVPNSTSISCYIDETCELTLVSYIEQDFYVDNEAVNIDSVSTSKVTTTTTITINGYSITNTVTTYTSIVTVSFHSAGNLSFSLYGTVSGEMLCVDAMVSDYIPISDCTISLSETSYVYDGNEKKPSVTVRENGTVLVEGTDYRVAYSNNVNAGTASVTVTGIGGYRGTVTESFVITKASQTLTVTIDNADIVAGATAAITASGRGAITYVSDNTSVATVSEKGVVSGLAAGTAVITVTAAGDDNYNKASRTVKVNVMELASCSVSYINNTMDGFKVVWTKVTGATGYYIYRRNDDGTYSATPTASVTGEETTEWTDPLVLTGGKDYTYKVAAYYEGSNGTIIVGPSGTTKTCKYLKGGEVESVTNTTSGLKVTWTKVDGANGYYVFRKAAGESDYTQVATVSSSSKVSWTDTSSLTSGKNYTYKVSAIFTNSKGQVTKGGAKTTKTAKYLTAGSISSLSNTSSGIYIKWSKVTGATGYYVYRKASSASSYTLVKTITSVGTTSYTDTAVKSSNNTTYTYYIQPYFKNSSGAITKAGYSTKAIVRLVAPAISSLTNSSSKTMTVKWGAKSGVTGYQVQYSASSSFASGNKTLTITGASSSSKVIASLTKGKTYYVRIRTYKTVNGTTYYSAWSTVMSVKISK